VLLTIAEDEEAATRTDGVNILRNFLAKCPAKILQSTGIGMVFQEAMFPSLLYLPSLTPENESIKLVSAAYDALLVLAQREADPQSSSRRTLLDKMLRDGILTGYQHASEYIAVVEVLSMKAEAIINQLQMYSAKHVQVGHQLLSVTFQP
jgi:hypothetical protein